VNQSEKHILVLRFPNRERINPYNNTQQQKPVQLRIKPKNGLVEVDIPLNVKQNFDQAKAIEYGQALRDSRVLQQGRSYGLPGGFGANPLPRPPRHAPQDPYRELPDEEELLGDFENAVADGHVITKITLGGRIQRPTDGEPLYFLGVFQDSR
jgi:hypothetical protein